VFADDVNLLHENILYTINRNPEALLGTSKEVCLEVYTERTKMHSCLIIRMQEKNKNIKIGSKPENMAEFEYLGRTVANQNCIQDEMKSKLNLENGLG